MRSPDSSRPPSLQRSPLKTECWITHATWYLLQLPNGTGTRSLCEPTGCNSSIEYSELLGVQQVASRGPYHSRVTQTVQVTQTIQGSTWNSSSPGSYSTTRTLLYPWQNRTHHPPMGDWVVLPAPYHQHTSTQRVSWPPSCSLTSTTSIRDPSWARPTRRLQGWPASTFLRPGDLEPFRHAQGRPDSSSSHSWCTRLVQTTWKPL